MPRSLGPDHQRSAASRGIYPAPGDHDGRRVRFRTMQGQTTKYWAAISILARIEVLHINKGRDWRIETIIA